MGLIKIQIHIWICSRKRNCNSSTKNPHVDFRSIICLFKEGPLTNKFSVFLMVFTIFVLETVLLVVNLY